MINDKIMAKINEYFPSVAIAYKDESKFMGALGKMLFFNQDFMTRFTTVMVTTIYFPNRAFVNNRPISSLVAICHELVHIYDSKRLTSPLFGFLYLFPQILVPFLLILLIASWKIALPALIICSLPLPAYFRMLFEKRAYLVTLYVMNALNNKNKYNIDLSAQKDFCLAQFKDSAYYFMWIFSDIDAEFDAALAKIKNNERPYDDKVFDMLDAILDQS